MNPSRKVIQSVVVELAWINRQIENINSQSSQAKELEQRKLELMDEIFHAEHIGKEVKHKQESLYH